MAEQKESVFAKLNTINVNEHTEKKNDLTYLSWAWAWGEVKKVYPDATYTIWKDECNRPYINDPELGIMCYTTVTIANETHEMWLPVMDSSNKAMRTTPYTYQKWDKYEKAWTNCGVEAATMFDINKTIMRCLVKNLAMFGLGLYIYAGEDLPEQVEETKDEPKKEPVKQTPKPITPQDPVKPAQPTSQPKQAELPLAVAEGLNEEEKALVASLEELAQAHKISKNDLANKCRELQRDGKWVNGSPLQQEFTRIKNQYNL